ncbi:hypothetical protein DAEQUDRAFT_303088 [Daedalea quercina L-15889]|uniref:Uncharacterized protein n=1 Tax=Daedalea quercina L-15889 TaxID=1314783 RepID=A0A165Q698_9APHY|nr:hypothetical protein DAEQUDRAFT_303088 [Daedalea quercina L-15889]
MKTIECPHSIFEGGTLAHRGILDYVCGQELTLYGPSPWVLREGSCRPVHIKLQKKSCQYAADRPSYFRTLRAVYTTSSVCHAPQYDQSLAKDSPWAYTNTSALSKYPG